MQASTAQATTKDADFKALSRRIDATDTPVIDFTRRALAQGRPDALSLAQGVVYWGPPPEALQAFSTALAAEPLAVSAYAPNEGLPPLRAALRRKVAERNGLGSHDVVVTPGCNQAFLNVLLSLCDVDDRVVLFRPYYFDHLMAVQMTGGAERVVYGEVDPLTLRPSLEWLGRALAGPHPPKMVVIVNPCNPTGVLMPRGELEAASAMCAAAGAWLVLDNTYEDFLIEPGSDHYCPPQPHVLHLFSFSKAYGMMGWRAGYVAYYDAAVAAAGAGAAPALPAADGQGHDAQRAADSDGAGGSGRAAAAAAPGALGMAQLKVQDAVCISTSQPGQRLALECLRWSGARGGDVLGSHLDALRSNRALLREALAPLEPHVQGGQGAIYLWARLPPSCQGVDDRKVVEWLVAQAGVCVVPGSAFGAPGHLRCSFGNLVPQKMAQAAQRLRAGLDHLVAHGPTPMAVQPP